MTTCHDAVIPSENNDQYDNTWQKLTNVWTKKRKSPFYQNQYNHLTQHLLIWKLASSR